MSDQPEANSSDKPDGAQGQTPDSEIPQSDGARVEFTSVLGQIVSLMGQSAGHRLMFMADLEWLVMPPLMRRQMRLWRRDTERGPMPVVYASWAFVSEEVDQRLASGQVRLSPTEWTSGDIMWLIDMIAPHGGGEAALRELAEKNFPGRTIKTLVPSASGGSTVREIRVDPSASSDAEDATPDAAS